jgi:hypothetical protein
MTPARWCDLRERTNGGDDEAKEHEFFHVHYLD